MARLVQRRDRLSKARKKAEQHVAAAIQAQFRRALLGITEHYGKKEFQKFLKADGNPVFDVSGDLDEWNGWEDWIAAFGEAVTGVLEDGADWIGATEKAFWTAKGKTYVYDPAQLVKDYQDRIGTKITNIADDTRESVQEKIASWYEEKGSLGDLTESLSSDFSETRAELIARTECGNVAAEVAADLMEQLGLTVWYWDAFLDWITCPMCMDLHGQQFMAGDDMPPDASHPGCRCSVALDPIEI